MSLLLADLKKSDSNKFAFVILNLYHTEMLPRTFSIDQLNSFSTNTLRGLHGPDFSGSDPTAWLQSRSGLARMRN